MEKCECGRPMERVGPGEIFCGRCGKTKTCEPIKCENCNKRVATQRWIGDEGTLGLIHGWSQWWCEVCCVEAQLEFIKKLVSKIPGLEKRLKEIKDG